MLKIQVEVDGIETEFTFTNSVLIDEIIWKGISIKNPKETVNFREDKSGLIDFSSMTSTHGVSTSHEVLYERLSEALYTYKEIHLAGLDDTEEEDIDTHEPQPYDPELIRVRRVVFSVYEINRMMTFGDIDLNPDFQRNFVWDQNRKTLFIESILLGIPIPDFFFAESYTGTYHVVDGLQRLSTIKQFLNNEFSLKEPEHLSDLHGMYYSNAPKASKAKINILERKYSRRVENTQLHVNVIESISPSKVKYDIFKRLNTGGRALNHQEVRNCIAEPHVRQYLRVLAKSDEFKKATGGSVSDFRMDAQELILRFTGFRLERLGKINYDGSMSTFLDEVVDVLNRCPNSLLEDIEKDFLKSMRINFYLFGEYSFRKCLSQHLLPNSKKQYINKALFVTWSVEAVNLNEEYIYKNVEFGTFAKKLAEKLDDQDKYYNTLTKGKGDKENLKNAANLVKLIIKENIK